MSIALVHLTVAYWIFTIIGILATFLQVVLTLYILYKNILKSDTWKKLEYQLILIRVLLDALNGIASLIYFLSSIPTLLYPEVVPFDVTFIIGIISSHFLEMRSFLAAIIAVERVLAVMIPLEFYKYRNNVSNYPILGFIVSTGIACDVSLFGVCGFRLPLAPGCANFGCATPPCYRDYSLLTKLIYSSTNFIFSAMLCCKMCWLSWKRAQTSGDVRRINWLSLTDGLSTLTFDLLPSLMVSSNLVNVTGLGPAIGSFRQVGRVVEALAMVQLMKKEVANRLFNNSRVLTL